jgi:hypothetical protein
MIRFVDIRNQGVGYRFAFWDTTVDRFVEVNGNQAWDNLEDLSRDAEATAAKHHLLGRLKSLCPKWASDGMEDDVEKWYAED